MENSGIVEKIIEGSLLSFDDETIKISGAHELQHPFGNYGSDLITLTKGLEWKTDVTYEIIREEYGRNHRLTWAGGKRHLAYFVRDD